VATVPQRRGAVAIVSTASGPTERSPMVGLSPGTRVGRYQIGELLGAGGMGAVYRAHDPYLSRDVALKLLHRYRQHLPDVGEQQDRLVREAQALARLSHPNVVAAHDVGIHDGAVFIAMELVAGVSLSTWLQSRPTRGEVLGVLVAAGRGLAAAHEAGVLHRDFTPANVMVSPDGRVRVVDFGLARAASEPADRADVPVAPARSGTPPPGTARLSPMLERDLTQGGALLGTIGFIAPEQVVGDTADARADQFSYAATVFYALVGCTPFGGATAEEYRAALVRRERAPWSAWVPRRLRRVVDRGLAVERGVRFPSLGAMVDELERARANRGRRPVAAAAVAALVVAGSALALAWSRETTAAPTCDIPASSAAVWDGARRGAVERAFVGTGRPHAAATFERVAAHLDGFQSRWLAMRRQACEATRERGEQSERMLELRNACLDRRRTQVATLVKLLGEANGALVDRAVDVTLQIAEIQHCSDTRALMGEAEHLPDDPVLLAEVADIESALDSVANARIAGRWDEALARAEQLMVRAQRLGHDPSLARATFEAATVQAATSRGESEATHHRALALASAAGLTRLTASISAGLFQLATNEGRWRDAELILPMVEAAVRQAGDPPSLRVELLKGQGLVLLAKGEHAAAIAKLEAAVVECARLGEAGPRKRLAVENELARALLEQGDLAGAARKMTAIIAQVRRMQGPNHPRVFMAYSNLANVLAEVPDEVGALAALAETRKLIAAMPAMQRNAAFIPATEGRLWQRLGDCRRALPLYREALDLFAAKRGGGVDETTTTHQRIGDCLIDVGQIADAIPHFEAWVKGCRTQRCPPASQAAAEFALARALWSVRSRRRRALRYAESAAELHREAGSSGAELRVVERWLASRRRGRRRASDRDGRP
jgi:tRNA A-37 threonylcarbamoyl transferase component Bud32/tetratricopeptide (TPR) repeat protein